MVGKKLNKIMIVDDDASILTVLKYSLEDFDGIEVQLLDSGEKAIEAVPKFKPDLIILDVMMPQMDGIETYNKIKSLPDFADRSFVFLTAKIQEDELQKYRNIGVADVISKPFDPITLKSEILKIWDRIQKVVDG